MFGRLFSAGGLFNSSCSCNFINWQHCHIRVIIFPSDIVPNFQIVKACHFQGCNCVDLVTLLWSVVLQVSGDQQRQKEGEWIVASSSHFYKKQERLLNPWHHTQTRDYLILDNSKLYPNPGTTGTTASQTFSWNPKSRCLGAGKTPGLSDQPSPSL